MGRKRPPRIPGFDYIGLHAYFLTICAEDRCPAFSDRALARATSTQFLQFEAKYHFENVVFCVMPDHMHALAVGVREDSNFRKFVSMFKQCSAHEYSCKAGRRLWQEGFFDHVVRDDESLLGIAAYIVHNPVRAGLCKTVSEYEFIGSSRYTIEQLIDAVQIKPRTRP